MVTRITGNKVPKTVAMNGDSTQAIILAGGLGTRFRSVRSDIPKSMAEIDGRPLLEHQVRSLRDCGVTRIVLCVGHLAGAVSQHFGDGTTFGLRIDYAVEREPLGTGGAILNARPFLDEEPFLVLNGDSLLPELPFHDIVSCHLAHQSSEPGTVGTLVVIQAPDRGAYGVIEMDTSGTRVLDFREKAPVDTTRAMISGGVYVLDPVVFDHIPAGRAVSVEREVFPTILEEGGRLWAYRYDGFFGDIGTPEGYQRVDRYMREAGKKV